jgi:hypothetical protein
MMPTTSSTRIKLAVLICMDWCALWLSWEWIYPNMTSIMN